VTASTSSPSTSREIVYETPKSSLVTGAISEEEEEGVDTEHDLKEKDVDEFGTKHFGELASPYVTPYLYNKTYLDRDYGIRKEPDGQF
jgi:hypothetical protein